MSDDGLQGLGGYLQQASNPPGLSLTEDTSHLKRLTLEQKHHLTYAVNVFISLIFTISPTHTHLIRAEAHVAKLQDRGKDGPYCGDLIGMQTDGLKALKQKLEVLLVLLPL